MEILGSMAFAFLIGFYGVISGYAIVEGSYKTACITLSLIGLTFLVRAA